MHSVLRSRSGGRARRFRPVVQRVANNPFDDGRHLAPQGELVPPGEDRQHTDVANILPDRVVIAR